MDDGMFAPTEKCVPESDVWKRWGLKSTSVQDLAFCSYIFLLILSILLICVI